MDDLTGGTATIVFYSSGDLGRICFIAVSIDRAHCLGSFVIS